MLTFNLILVSQIWGLVAWMSLGDLSRSQLLHAGHMFAAFKMFLKAILWACCL